MFETCVSQIVKTTLTNEPVRTEFYNGCLFVSPINESQARTVFHRLSQTLGVGTVQVTPIGNTGEYAFDFVEAPEEIYSPYLGAV
jgi:hypothetical protein